ncbi:MAG TPA: penicillin-binding protein 2 [Paracoccaceae bacterium]|nr:penicillin-binding protein 2 [Paracoccaceae bacterium]
MIGPRHDRRANGATERLPITRRGFLLLGMQTAVAGALAWRIRRFQMVEHERYRLLAEENRISMRLIAPARGKIFDRSGEELAINTQNFRVVMIREQAGDAEEMLDRLGQLIEIPEHQRRRALKELMEKPAFVPVAVAEHLAWDDFARVNVNAPALPGIQPEVGLSRHYPHGEMGVHVIGYVGRVTKRDLESVEIVDPILRVPEFQIGKTGIERALDTDLRGSAGTRQIEVNAAGRVIRELERNEGEAGEDLHLTIDLGLQKYCLERLGEESAAAVLMDVDNGDILAAASSPSYDPNPFVLGIGQQAYDALLNNDHRPLHNKWASGMYPPGSTFKVIVALAALEAGIGPGETAYCPGFLKLGKRRFHCWRSGGHGRMNLQDSLEQSCDVYYYEMARRIGIDKIADMAARLGLGIENSLPIPSISTGLIPTRAWKRANRDEDWQVGDTLNAGIGQGFVLATPLQLAVMTARIASGRGVQPRLIRARAGQPVPMERQVEMGIPPHHFEIIRRGMHGVVNGSRGTARGARIKEDFWLMAGKTGTSQVRNITAAERARGVFRNEDLPWRRRDHALFVGYAPSDAPRFAVSVIVEHGGGGSAVAAPIARDILLEVQKSVNPTIAAPSRSGSDPGVPYPVARPVDRA